MERRRLPVRGQWRANFVLAAAASLVVFSCSTAFGCSGAQGTDDPDLVKKDSGKDTGKNGDSSDFDTALDDTGSADDTGAGDDSRGGDDGAADGGTSDTDAGAKCTPVDVEPNDTESTAVLLKDINDCDSSGGSFSGVLDDASDIDWFHYRGKDTIGCVVDPTLLGPTSVQLCVFVKCLAGTSTTFKSCVKGVKATSPDGNPGCCGDGGAQIDYTCPAAGTSDSADVWMSVSGATSTCSKYTVTYHF